MQMNTVSGGANRSTRIPSAPDPDRRAALLLAVAVIGGVLALVAASSLRTIDPSVTASAVAAINTIMCAALAVIALAARLRRW